MRFHKIISTILHPIVMPTLGILLYFIFVSQSLMRKQQLIFLCLVFGITYLVPLLTLILLKTLGFIEDFELKTIKERRFPVLFMVLLFYLLGNVVVRIYVIRDLGFLFYGTALSLLIIYFLFSFKIKSSLHLVSMGNTVGFFIIISNSYYLPLLPIIMVLILLSGLLASSRLYLNAHSPKELFLGFSFGFASQIIVFWALYQLHYLKQVKYQPYLNYLG